MRNEPFEFDLFKFDRTVFYNMYKSILVSDILEDRFDGIKRWEHGVYVVCDVNNVPVYIGQTNDLKRRLKQHLSWISVGHIVYFTEGGYGHFEGMLIRKYQPEINVTSKKSTYYDEDPNSYTHLVYPKSHIQSDYQILNSLSF